MRLYNSLSRQLEPLDPNSDPVTLYVCGITPYDTTHLGHAFTYLVFDTLIRYLESQGRAVRYVQNVTDIDDDILRRAAKVGMAWDRLAEQETTRFLADLRALNVRMPDEYPKATEEISMILTIAQRLLEMGLAYERNGSVYFRVAKEPSFGKLSRYDYPTMLRVANERGNHPDDPNKDDPLDFVLWQAAQPGEPSWASPWGEGRPGWHIECSAMALRYLGPTIDIHGGGGDLLFPHHECEIAQSESYTGTEPFVRIWMHIAMVRMDGEKMSKSLGNMVFARDLLRRYRADAIRAYLLSNHYRSAFEWDEAAMVAAAKRAERWLHAAQTLSGGGDLVESSGAAARFHDAMNDDLNTPRALDALDALSEAILRGAERGADVRAAQAHLRSLAHSIGFTLVVRQASYDGRSVAIAIGIAIGRSDGETDDTDTDTDSDTDSDDRYPLN